MSRAAAIAVFLAPGLTACGLPLGSSNADGPTNTCNRSGDCAAEAACVQNKCVATSYDLDGLLLQVRTPATSSFAPSASFVLDPAALGVELVAKTPAQPFNTALNLPLPAPVSIKGAEVVLDPTTMIAPGCSLPQDGSVPAQVTFFRLPKLAGLPFDPVRVSTAVSGKSYAFDVELVSGKDDLYDVYIEPQVPSGCPMSIPPYFLPAQSIDPSKTLWQLPPIGTLSGTLAGLSDPNWELDLVEPTRGLPISAGSTLSVDTMPSPPPPATFSAKISPVAPGQTPILRLSPTITNGSTTTLDPTRPTIYWTLEGAITGGTKANPVVSLKSDLVTNTVNVGGQILGSDGLTGITSQLTIQSKDLLSDVGGNASFTLAHLTDGPNPGQFQVPLPPGDYWIRAVPVAQNGLSITDKLLTWPMSTPMGGCVCGKTVKLDAKGSFAGTVKTATGDVLPDTSIALTPSQGLARSYLADTHALSPISPRAVTATTDGTGSFLLLVDQGTSDFTVQPDPSTFLPWLVIPQITPAPGSQPTTRWLKNAAFLSGTVLDPHGMPVANAEIDAWYPVRQDPNQPASATGTVVKIATATTDASGAYTLVLPSSI